MTSKSFFKQHSDWWWGYFFIAPTTIGLLVLNFYPIFSTIVMSFSESGAFNTFEFAGAQNYTTLLGDSQTWVSLKNTLIFSLTSVPIGILIAVVLAAMMSQKIKGVGLYRVLYFAPMLAAPAAVSMIWRLIFNTDYGILNSLLNSKIDWLNDPKLAMLSIVIISIWSNLGQQIIILIAAITGVSQELYEAASLDGAGPIRQLFSVTIPQVSPSIFFLSITGFIGAIKQFDIIYMIYGILDSPALNSVRTLMYTYYIQAFVAQNKAYASAIVMVVFLVVLAFTVIQFIGEKKFVNYD